MTLIIAADVQDHLILAGDHCAVLSGVSNQPQLEVVLDHYRKIYPWKYGVIGGSGDVFLMACFYRAFQYHESTGRPIDLLQVANDAKAARSRHGVCSSKSVGNIFLTLPGRDGFELFLVSVGKDIIGFEIVEPISARFSMREGKADESACDAFVGRLRPSFFFREVEDFHRHHAELLKQFFLEHSRSDALITASFDVCMLDKRTGIGTFWHVSETPKRLAFVHLSAEDAAGATGSFSRVGSLGSDDRSHAESGTGTLVDV